MPSPKKKSESKAIGTWPTPEHTDVGKLAKVRDTYVLKVARRTVKFTASAALPTKDLDRLVGKEVLVAFSPKRKTDIVAITRWPRTRPTCYWILCYLPVPDIMKRIHDELRGTLLTRLEKAGVVPPGLAAEFRIGYQARR